jgi:hypothetical protein
MCAEEFTSEKYNYKPAVGKVIVYILICPIDGYVKYVGVTGVSIGHRLNSHLRDKPRYFKDKLYGNISKIEWIDRLKSNNRIPIIDIIDIVDYDDVEFWETHYISLYKYFGFKLFNIIEEKHRYKNKRIKSEIKRKEILIQDKKKWDEYNNINFGLSNNLF